MTTPKFHIPYFYVNFLLRKKKCFFTFFLDRLLCVALRPTNMILLYYTCLLHFINNKSNIHTYHQQQSTENEQLVFYKLTSLRMGFHYEYLHFSVHLTELYHKIRKKKIGKNAKGKWRGKKIIKKIHIWRIDAYTLRQK